HQGEHLHGSARTTAMAEGSRRTADAGRGTPEHAARSRRAHGDEAVISRRDVRLAAVSMGGRHSESTPFITSARMFTGRIGTRTAPVKFVDSSRRATSLA